MKTYNIFYDGEIVHQVMLETGDKKDRDEARRKFAIKNNVPIHYLRTREQKWKDAP